MLPTSIGGYAATSPRRQATSLVASRHSPQRGKRERLILLRNRLLKIFIFYFLDKTAYIIKAVNKQNKLAFPCGVGSPDGRGGRRSLTERGRPPPRRSGICERSEQMTREVFRRRGEVVAKRRERS